MQTFIFFPLFFFFERKIMNRGLMIVIEGCDRAGKSTQCERLVNQLRQKGTAVELLKFPGYISI